MWTETAKGEKRIFEEKSVVNLVNGFVILVLILLFFFVIIMFSACDMYEVKNAFP